MTWTYEQKTGALRHDGVFIDRGYAGSGKGVNNPAMQDVPNVGPLPCGVYRIGDPYYSSNVGPYALKLAPDAANVMFGRSEFRIHGDSIEKPGTASHGCIVLPRKTREEIVKSGDRELHVVSGEAT